MLYKFEFQMDMNGKYDLYELDNLLKEMFPNISMCEPIEYNKLIYDGLEIEINKFNYLKIGCDYVNINKNIMIITKNIENIIKCIRQWDINTKRILRSGQNV